MGLPWGRAMPLAAESASLATTAQLAPPAPRSLPALRVPLAALQALAARSAVGSAPQDRFAQQPPQRPHCVWQARMAPHWGCKPLPAVAWWGLATGVARGPSPPMPMTAPLACMEAVLGSPVLHAQVPAPKGPFVQHAAPCRSRCCALWALSTPLLAAPMPVPASCVQVGFMGAAED